MLLQHRTAVVCGGGRSVGGAIARAFAREGARVHLAGRTAATLQAVANDIAAAGGQAHVAIVDALNEAEVDGHAAAVVERSGTLDISVDVITDQDVQGTPMVEMSVEDYVRSLEVAVRSKFHTLRAAARHMIRQGSGVILTFGGTFDWRVARQLRISGVGTTFDAVEAMRRRRGRPYGIRVVTLRTVAQVALADPDATVDSLRTAHERVLVSGAEQERLIDALLTLARGQGGLRTREPFDVATVTSELLLTRREEAERRGVALRESLSPAPAAGDRRLAERLIANLLDNALAYNDPHGHVDVDVGTRAGRAVVSVTNTGQVVQAGEVERLLQPFERNGPDRAGHGHGVGLGLSIVHAIAEAHGASWRLTHGRVAASSSR